MMEPTLSPKPDSPESSYPSTGECLARLLRPPLPPNVPVPSLWASIPQLSHRSSYRQITRELSYKSVLLAAKAILSLGIRPSTHLAAFIGTMGYYLRPELRRIALQNLRDAIGTQTTEQDRARIARQMFSNFTVSALEVAWLSRWEDLFSWLKIDLDGFENFNEALATGRGVIAHNAHFGNWEVMTAAIARMGYPAHVVVRKQKDPRLEAWIGQIRNLSGLKVITRGENPVAILRCLKKGGALGLMIDIDTRSNEGVFVDFFGKPTYTQVGPFALARLTGALMVPALCYREGLNHLRFYFGKPWEVPQTEDPARDIFRSAQMASRILEDRIRERPEQWAWFHKRWKTTPDKIE
ncbi:lysophospholipid acyltransferase family protein [bacterium]|nr:lysophospholipid acyltransferase family protein [bacterium]NUP91854.1 lysophospholipid acyltransferase family protein [Candidatus Omnitrophota bacterium]